MLFRVIAAGILMLFLVSSGEQSYYTHPLSFTGSPQQLEQLGEMLFFDRRFSRDSSISCGSCHRPEFAFADTASLSKGVGSISGKRNAPSVTNMASRTIFFYDGRAATLEDQVHFPVEDPLEMQLPFALAVQRIAADPLYQKAFRRITGKKPDAQSIEKAIAAFERSLETADTPFDDFMKGDSLAMSESARRGRLLFMSEKSKCFDCHFSPDFTVDDFRNIGLYNGKNLSDPGRFAVSGDSADLGRFKVPGLRNVAMTAPYMHNGMFSTLEEVVDYYDHPDRFVPDALNRDSLLQQPLQLSKQEKVDLVAFLRSLTDRRFNR